MSTSILKCITFQNKTSGYWLHHHNTNKILSLYLSLPLSTSLYLSLLACTYATVFNGEDHVVVRYLTLDIHLK